MTGFPSIVRKLIPNLGRENEREVVAARDAIVRALASVGLDLHDLAAAIPTKQMPAQWSSADMPPSFGDLARACRDLDHGRLLPHERSFVHQMCRMGFNRRPSQHQADWLAAIFTRLQQSAAA